MRDIVKRLGAQVFEPGQLVLEAFAENIQSGGGPIAGQGEATRLIFRGCSLSAKVDDRHGVSSCDSEAKQQVRVEWSQGVEGITVCVSGCIENRTVRRVG